MTPIPVADVVPVSDKSYLVFCPDDGGWHTAEWWANDGRGRWSLVYAVEYELAVSHVMDVPPDPMTETDVRQWIIERQLNPPLEPRA